MAGNSSYQHQPDAANQPPDEVKAGLWKCPYHNASACVEIIKQLAENE